MLMVNENSKEFRIAAGANGGVAAPSALVNVLARITRMDQSAKEAVAAPRVHHGGDPDVTYYEPGLSAEALAYLSQSGHRTAATPVLGTVNVLYCPNGLPTKPVTCQMVADPRGLGLAAGSMQ
jgi:gamma-glutamyltranspeptidase/glutathione hydrolase